MTDAPQPKNPLHGITLAQILEHLVSVYGWEDLGAHINIRCFTENPSIKSSLTFLRKTDWARAKVERLYLKSLRYRSRANDATPADSAPFEANPHAANPLAALTEENTSGAKDETMG